jgi:hypothetical protein
MVRRGQSVVGWGAEALGPTTGNLYLILVCAARLGSFDSRTVLEGKGRPKSLI